MRNVLLLLLISFLLLIACCHTSQEQKGVLVQADSIVSSHPEHALHLLRTIGNYQDLNMPDRALYALLMTQALDKCDSVVQSDTLIRIATEYYGKKDPNRAGYAWFYRARCCNNMGDARGQADALLKALEYADQEKNYRLKGFVYSDKAKIYQTQNLVDSALHYNLLAYSYLKQAGDRRNCTVCLLHIGYSFYRKNQFEAAIKYYGQAIKENPNMEPLLLTSFHRQQCLVYYCLRNYNKALYYARLSTSRSDAFDHNKWINLAMIFNKMNVLDSSIYYLKKCPNPREMASEYYQTWVDISARQKKYDAVVYYLEKLVPAKDSIFRHSLTESFAGLEKKYRYEEIASQNKSLTITNQHDGLIILLLILSLSIGGIVFTVFQNRQSKRLLVQQRRLTENEKALAKGEQEKSRMLQTQLYTQQQALSALNRLRSQWLELSGAKKNSNKPTVLTVKEQAAVDHIVGHVIQNIDLLYNNFSTRLATAFPGLLDNDMIICCLLLAGFDHETIHTTLNLQSSSYNVKRTNLRKKLGLSHKTNLTDFLAEF